MSNAPESFQTHQLVNDLFEQAKEVSYKGEHSCSSRYGNKGAFKRGVLSTVDGVSLWPMDITHIDQRLRSV